MMSQRYAIPLAGLAVFCIFALASIQSPRAGKTALEEINGDAHNLPESGETVDR